MGHNPNAQPDAGARPDSTSGAPPDSAPGSPGELSRAIKQAAREAGFELSGITPAVTPAGFSRLVEWVAAGRHGTMEYIPRRLDAYADPNRVLPGARSVIALGMNYAGPSRPTKVEPEAGTVGRVARYAQGGVDYHDLIRERLRSLLLRISQLAPQSRARGVVDTAPVLERDFAQAAGLGWFGKNTMLINKSLGSWLFLAAVLVDIELDYDSPHLPTHCGTCTRCLDACPTQAFDGPHVLDARKCISYLTIEHRGPIAPELRTGMADWLFGCDICQEVCPWNRKAPGTQEPAFEPQSHLTQLGPADLLQMTAEEFAEQFAHTPLARPGWAGMKRNAVLVLANTGTAEAVPVLASLEQDADPVVRGTAAWGLGRLGGGPAHVALVQWLSREPDAAVQAELRQALARTDQLQRPPSGTPTGATWSAERSAG